MKKTIALLTLAAALAAPMAAQAHRAWLAPTATTLSGTDAWVGFDAGMSNQVFNPDHAAMRLLQQTRLNAMFTGFAPKQHLFHSFRFNRGGIHAHKGRICAVGIGVNIACGNFFTSAGRACQQHPAVGFCNLIQITFQHLKGRT